MRGTSADHLARSLLRRFVGIPRIGTRWLVVIWLAYLVFFYWSLRSSTSSTGALAIVPTLLTVWGRGWRAGAVAGVVVAVVNTIASLAASETWWSLASAIGWISLVVIAVIAGGAWTAVVQLVEQIERAETAQQRLEAVRTDYRTLYEDVPVGLWRTTPDGTIVEVNPAFARFFDRTVEEILTMTAHELYQEPETRAERIETLMRDRISHGMLLPMVRKDGNPVFIRANTQVVHDEHGEVLYFDGVGVDVTAEIQSEQARIASDARFRSAFEGAPIGMALTSPDFRILRANRALERFLGYERGELDGVAVADISHPDDMAENLEIHARAEGGSFQMHKRYVRKDGELVTALLVATQFDPTMMVSFVVDLSDQLRAQQALEELVRSKDEFLATVSHELRTPLTVVHGMAHELRDNWDSFDAEEARELAGLIADQSSELSHLVEDLLVVARAEAGTLEVMPQAVNLRAEVEAALASVPVQVAEIVTVQCDERVVQADRLRVRQILRNLLTNAHRYGGTEVQLRAALLQELGLCSIQVRDDGPGVPAELATSIFEPYQRAHSLGIATEAVGLGLTVSRTLAESMGGSLEYRREDGWSVFDLTLRIVETIDERTDEVPDDMAATA